MQIKQEVVEFLDGVASFAESFRRKLAWLVGLGLIASCYIAYLLFSPESSWWWNSIKCGVVMLPCFIWLFIWNTLGQLREAPQLASTLAQREGGLFADLNRSRPSLSVGGVFSTLRAFRNEEGLEVVMDTVGSVTLLANPLFAIFACLMIVLLFMIILISPFILIL